MIAIKSIKNKIQGKKGEKKEKEGIETPEDFDILLGRGKTSFNHVGNRRFRVFIGLHLRRYMDASSRMEKTLVVNSVVEAIQEGGGRFLKQDMKTEKWYQVNAKMAREKVGHALRDAVGMRMKIANGSQTKAYDRRTSDIMMERARRASVTADGASFSQIKLPKGELPRMARSCNDLAKESPEVRKKGTIEDDARKALLELEEEGLEKHDDETPNKLSANIALLQIGLPGSALSKVSPDESIGRLKMPLSRLGSNAKNYDPNSDAVSIQASHHSDDTKTKMSQESTELSIMSEGTNKKWFDLGSGEFSVQSVDSQLFDEGPPADLVNKVSQKLTGVDTMADSSSSTVRQSNSLARRKKNTKSKAETDISEDFSIMSISPSLPGSDEIKMDEFPLRSDEFGTKSEEFLKNNSIKSEEFGLKSEDFLQKTDDFGLKSDDLLQESTAQQTMNDALARGSSEMSLRSSWMLGSSMEMRSSKSSEFILKMGKAAGVRIDRSSVKSSITWGDKSHSTMNSKSPLPISETVPESTAASESEAKGTGDCTSGDFNAKTNDSEREWNKTLEALAT